MGFKIKSILLQRKERELKHQKVRGQIFDYTVFSRQQQIHLTAEGAEGAEKGKLISLIGSIRLISLIRRTCGGKVVPGSALIRRLTGCGELPC